MSSREPTQPSPRRCTPWRRLARAGAFAVARSLAFSFAFSLAASSAWAQPAADPLSDAPEGRAALQAPPADAPPSYTQALLRWRSAADINAWIGARFEYDRARAMQLSETQRRKNGRLPIIAPRDFFAQPSGVCVDLTRFAVETLRQVDPDAKATYLMIEFDPFTIAGNLLRRHWLVSFEAGGQRYFFADSKRPGHLAGPYASTREFIEEYEKYRGRRIVAFHERASYERQVRAAARRQGTQTD